MVVGVLIVISCSCENKLLLVFVNVFVILLSRVYILKVVCVFFY